MLPNLSVFTPPNNVLIRLCVDYILTCSDMRKHCKSDTLELLRYRSMQQICISKRKLHLWKTEVKYLRYVVSQQGTPLDTERKKSSFEVLWPVTKCNMIHNLGMTNFSRQWIPCYAEKSSCYVQHGIGYIQMDTRHWCSCRSIGKSWRSTAYYSTKLDPVATAVPQCL